MRLEGAAAVASLTRKAAAAERSDTDGQTWVKNYRGHFLAVGELGVGTLSGYE